MTPINNNQMSEELNKLARDYSFFAKDTKLYESGIGISFDGRQWKKFIDELSTLISHERAEAVGGFVDFIVESNGIDDDYNITSLKRHLQEYLKTKEEV